MGNYSSYGTKTGTLTGSELLLAAGTVSGYPDEVLNVTTAQIAALGGGRITLTDGTDEVSNVLTITVIGGTVSGSAGNATLTITGSNSAPSMVQYDAVIQGSATTTATLSAAPTYGNLLVALFSHYNNGPTVANGYTLLETQDGNEGNGYSTAYKFVSSHSEPVAQQPFNSGSSGNGLVVFELSGAGAAPVFAAGANDQASASNTLAGFLAGFSLCTGFMFQQNSTAGFTIAGATPLTSITSTLIGGCTLTPFTLTPGGPGVTAVSDTALGTPGYISGVLAYTAGT